MITVRRNVSGIRASRTYPSAGNSDELHLRALGATYHLSVRIWNRTSGIYILLEIEEGSATNLDSGE